MARTWRTRLQIAGGFALILLALWIVIGGGSGSTQEDAPSSARTEISSASGAPSSQQTPSSGLSTVAESALPEEGRETLALIRAGGPFPYDRDGITFGNREGILPQQEGRYYREYTVPTPGEDDRGARRIVGGRSGDQYYTDDHYESFRQIELGR